jgi:hypothetical protein
MNLLYLKLCDSLSLSKYPFNIFGLKLTSVMETSENESAMGAYKYPEEGPGTE